MSVSLCFNGLDDVGREVVVVCDNWYTDVHPRMVLMGVRAPNGDQCFIWGSRDPDVVDDSRERKAEAVREFVKGHRNGTT